MPAEDGYKRFETTSLALATFLILKGCEHGLVLDDEHRGIGGWTFEHSGDLADLIAEFENGRALVNPRDYHYKVSEVRKELFDFLREEGVWQPWGE